MERDNYREKLTVGGGLNENVIIAKWECCVAYEVRVRQPISDEDMMKALPSLFSIRKSRNGSTVLLTFYGKGAYDDAQQAISLYDGTLPKPVQVWRMEAPRSTVLNMDSEALEKWSDPIVFTTENHGMGSVKGRHRFQFIACPIGVRALADYFIRHPNETGNPTAWKGVQLPALDFSDLVVIVNKDSESESKDPFNDETLAQLCGKADKSVTWSAKYPAQRAALWLALGENDPTKSRALRKDDNGKPIPDKAATTSVLLGECLDSMSVKMRGWAKVVQFVDPGMDNNAFNQDGERKKISAISHWYDGEADARKEADVELERKGKAQSGGGGDGLPLVPDVWKSTPEDVETFKKTIVEMKDAPVAVVAQRMLIEPSDVVAWRKALGV